MLAVHTAELPATSFTSCMHPPMVFFPAPFAFTNRHAGSSQKFATAISIAELMLVFCLLARCSTKFTGY
jgi:hypothetical protein